MLYNKLLGTIFRAVFENEGGDPDPNKPKEGEPNPPGSSDTTFTQEQVNSMMAEQKRLLQKTINDQVLKVENLSKTANLTKEEKEALAKQVSTIKQSLETEKQKAAREKAEQKTQFENQIAELSSTRDRYKQLYESSTIKRSISDAASAHKAIQNIQVLAILEPNTSLVEDTDENGQGLGTFKPVVKFTDTDKEGKPVQVLYSPADAVKRMTELREFSNLFESTNKGGLGRNTAGTGTVPTLKTASNSTENWVENRKAFGLK